MDKIHVTFPPGCYGHYIMQSILVYSNLKDCSVNKISFNKTGSSHNSILQRKKYFSYNHDMNTNSDIIIGGASGHELDYIVNQFLKNDKDIHVHLSKIFPDHEDVIQQGWKTLNTWAVREWLSIIIGSYLQNVQELSKKNLKYSDLTTAELFDKDEDVFPRIINQLIKKIGLNNIADVNTIKQNHKKFIFAQKNHNLQKRCDQWIKDTILGKIKTSPCVSIIDEAYIQYQLRNKGYEISCDGLNNFPKNSKQLKLIIAGD